MTMGRASHGAIVVAAAIILLMTHTGTARAQAKLEFKYPEGKPLQYKTTSNAFQTLNLMGMEIQSSEKRTQVWSLTGGKRRGDGSQPIAFKTLSLRTDLKLQGGIELSFDSAKPDSFSADKNFAEQGDVYRFYSNLAYTLIIDDHGHPKAVEDLAAIVEKASKLDPISREMVHGQVDPEKIKLVFEQEQTVFPDRVLKPGDTWERKEWLDSQSGMVLSVKKKYTYTGSEKKGDRSLDKLTSKVLEVKHNEDSASKLPLKITKSDLNVDSSEGSLLFDRELGCVVEAQERTKIKGNVTFSAGGMDIPSPLSLNLRSEKILQPAKGK